MMKTTSVLLLLCAGCYAAHINKPTVNLDPLKAVDILAGATACLLEAPLSAEVLAEIRDGEFPDKADKKNFEKFVYCGIIKTGYGKKNGHIKVDKALEVFPKNIDREPIKKAIELCNSKDGATPAETAVNFFKCFSIESPVKAVL